MGGFLAQTNKLLSWRKTTPSLKTLQLKRQTTTKSLSRLFGLSWHFKLKTVQPTSNQWCPAASPAESNYVALNPIHCSASSKNKVRSDKLSAGEEEEEEVQRESSIHGDVFLSLTLKNVDLTKFSS